MADVDYRAITPDPSKPTADYSADERRADLLARIEEKGHPRLLPPYRVMAETYGCDPSRLTHDMNSIAEYVSASLGDRHALTVDAVFRRSLRGLIEQGEYRQAAKTAAEWSEWVDRRTVIRDLCDRLDALADERDAPLTATDTSSAPTYPELVPTDDGALAVRDGVADGADAPTPEGE